MWRLEAAPRRDTTSADGRKRYEGKNRNRASPNEIGHGQGHEDNPRAASQTLGFCIIPCPILSFVCYSPLPWNIPR